ncbi:MAG: GAF domain-containing protein [Candidatus Heimdallarchaeota archaeon]|nr:GAF domain-containing protein [Candidatus Heimdallarchaeota archaeon]
MELKENYLNSESNNLINSNLFGFFRVDFHNKNVLKTNNKMLEICSLHSQEEFNQEFIQNCSKSNSFWDDLKAKLLINNYLENYLIEFSFTGKPKLYLTINVLLSLERNYFDVVVINKESNSIYTAEQLLKRDRKAFQIVAEAAINSTSLTELCQIIIDGIVSTFNFDIGSVLLYDDSLKMFNIIAYNDTTNSNEIPLPFSIDDTRYIHSHVGRTLQSVFSQDVKNDPFVLSFLNKHDMDSEIRALITWPLISSKKKLLGTQLVALNPKEISEKDKDLFKSIADLFALVIERTIAENNLYKLNEELELRVFSRTAELDEVNKELEAFSYSVSHDLRAPLRHIAGYLELIKKNIDNIDEKIAHYFDTIVKSTKEMNNLIDDLLSFSKISRYELFKDELNLYQIIYSIISEFDPDLQGRNIEWQIRELPLIKGDYSLIRIAIKNLISNAIKFTSPIEKARIEIGYLQHDERIEPIFYIKDNGVGFDMNFYDKLFGVFQRLHSDKEFEGTGIGLAMVKRIITKHNGTVWAESIKGEGSTFYFSMGS